MSEKSKDLEHVGIQAQLKVMAADISVNFAKIESNINVNFLKVESNISGLRLKGDTESEVRGIQLENILNEQKKTNGKIIKLEKTTEVLRVMSEHKWLTGGFLYGIFNILQLIKIENIISWIKFFV